MEEHGSCSVGSTIQQKYTTWLLWSHLVHVGNNIRYSSFLLASLLTRWTDDETVKAPVLVLRKMGQRVCIIRDQQ